MSHPIYPCLWFDGQAKNAAEFYCSVFKHSHVIESNPLVVLFELDGQKIMGLNGGPMFKMNPSISLFVNCILPEDVNRIWDQLIQNGKALIPIDQYPWSKRYGWLQDRYGFTWQISLSEKNSIVPSMLFTSIHFGQAESAMQFYHGIFDQASIEKIIPYTPEDVNAGKVLYSEFSLNHSPLIAMDGPGVHDYTFNEGVSFVVECDTQAEIDHYWKQLTLEGEESMCGWLKDKFGISWQIIPKDIGKWLNDPKRGQKVGSALMKMKKLDIQTLMQA